MQSKEKEKGEVAVGGLERSPDTCQVFFSLSSSHKKDGTLSQTIMYKDGIEHGKSRSYLETGSLKSIVIYKNGKRDGE